MATITGGLTKKLTPTQVRSYKRAWEKECAASVYALSRGRFSFYYSVYKNPGRLREALTSIPGVQLNRAIAGVREAIAQIDPTDEETWWGDARQNPIQGHVTRLSLTDLAAGRVTPSFLPDVAMHPSDGSYPYEFGTEQGLSAFYAFDVFVQVQAQVVSEAYGTMPLEDLYRYTREEDFDHLNGKLITFLAGSWGKNIELPDGASATSIGQIQMRKTINGRLYRTQMAIRNMYLFSTTAAINMQRARICGLGMFAGATREGKEITLTVIPLLIGMGGLPTQPFGR